MSIDGVYVASLQDLCITKARAFVPGDGDRREKDFEDFSWCLKELTVRKLPFIDDFVILNVLDALNIIHEIDILFTQKRRLHLTFVEIFN